MKEIFDKVSAKCSKSVTQAYSTSFSLGIYFLDKKFHASIYGIYGFVRLADEIVDSFHDFDKAVLLKRFREDTVLAIEQKISLNPVLNEFQRAVNTYSIDWELIDTFLKSMEMDLQQTEHSGDSYNQYILGSAEVVGLMCLKVFVESDAALYERLKPFAMKLGSAFQKVNFLRDLNADFNILGRTYFPDVNFSRFTVEDKQLIEKEIGDEFDEALVGIKKLPYSSRKGVYLAYIYYRSLFEKIKNTPASQLMNERIRVSDHHKIGLMFNSLVRNKLNWL
jgi:phytoene synthase